MPETPQELARELSEEMLELLKLLNRAEEEHRDVNGYELSELVHLLGKIRGPTVDPPAVERALTVLVANRLAAVAPDEEYAWERGRVVGPRYLITTRGKEFLVARIGRVDRIE
ncbi:MAG TPA: hypothetical protein VMG99_08120 [Thermoplasmata archaeon]|nr:hypothetical protein [Thermoplasmata archaeon]